MKKIVLTFGRAFTVGILITLISTLCYVATRPLVNAALTFLEPFPIGVAVTLISALVLRKRAEPMD